MSNQAQKWLQLINDLPLKQRLRIMNVCGGHERTIAQSGLRSLLAESFELIPGPGCPVCVCPEEDIYLVSAKAGTGVKGVLEAIVKQIPHPRGSIDSPAQALIFDSMFDSYRGVITYIRVFEGSFHKNDIIKFFQFSKQFEVAEIGILKLTREPVDELRAGEVGYLISGAKDVAPG